MCVYIIINKQPNEMENIYYTSPKNDIFAVNQMFADGKAFKEIFIAIEKHSVSSVSPSWSTTRSQNWILFPRSRYQRSCDEKHRYQPRWRQTWNLTFLKHLSACCQRQAVFLFGLTGFSAGARLINIVPALWLGASQQSDSLVTFFREAKKDKSRKSLPQCNNRLLKKMS